MFRIATLALIGAVLGESAAAAESCKVQSSKPPGQWTFVRVHDVDKDQVVLRQGINGGDAKRVEVSGHRIRIEQKPAGHRNYRSGPVTDCKGGRTVRF